jgi:hypothetical protein
MDPRGRAVSRAGALRFTRPLEGAVVGVIENSKPNFDIYSMHVLKVLTEHYGVSDSVYVAKESAAIAAEDADYQRVVGLCDLVFAGSGD